jgi:hypothetical protein
VESFAYGIPIKPFCFIFAKPVSLRLDECKAAEIKEDFNAEG